MAGSKELADLFERLSTWAKDNPDAAIMAGSVDLSRGMNSSAVKFAAMDFTPSHYLALADVCLERAGATIAAGPDPSRLVLARLLLSRAALEFNDPAASGAPS